MATGLKVRTDIPYGNACLVEVKRRDGVPEILFTSAPHGGPESLWFCFRVEAARKGRLGRIRIVLKHFKNLLGWGSPAVCSPVMRLGDGEWRRIGPGREETLPDGQVQGVWEADCGESSTADFAVCFPYGCSELEGLVKASSGYWRCDQIGASQQARALKRLSNSYGSAEAGKLPGLYLISRQHSGETPGSWALHGFLGKFAAMDVRDILVWAVPLSNIDGVEGGDYGKDNFPYDLNRAWGQPPMRHETQVIQRDMHRWKERCIPAAGIDFHAPGYCETDGIYCFLPPADTELGAKADKLAEALRVGVGPEFAAPQFARRASYASRWNTPNFTSGFCFNEIKMPALSFETPYSMIDGRDLGIADYISAGERLAEAAVSYMRGLR